MLREGRAARALLSMRARVVALQKFAYHSARAGDNCAMNDPTPLIFPTLGNLYQALAPWAYALLRIAVGLALVPHGLRNTFGMFPTTGVRSHSIAELAEQIDRDGYRPGWLWAPLISLTQLVGGPLVAVGLFNRGVAVSDLQLLI